MKKITLLLLFILFISSKGIAQTKPDNDKYWIEVGTGMYSNPKTGGFNEAYWFNYIHNNTLYRARFIENQEFDLFGPSPNESDKSFGLMISKSRTSKVIGLNASIGLGITSGFTRGELIEESSFTRWSDLYERKKYISPSIPIELDFIIKPLKFVGLGVSFIGDANLNRPYMGFMVKAGFGKYR